MWKGERSAWRFLFESVAFIVDIVNHICSRSVLFSKSLTTVSTIAMIPTLKNFHHPFETSDFGFSIENYAPSDNTSVFLVDDIDLYHQPVPDPKLGIIFFMIRTTIIIIGEFIQFKVLKLVEKENGLVNKIAKLYILTLMISSPIWLVFLTTTDFVHSLNEILGKWYCTSMRLFVYLSFSIIAFHSVSVAFMRYFFIVHEKKIKVYGRKKIEHLFLLLNFFVPVVLVVWDQFDATDLDAMSFLNKCNGLYHKVFLVDTSTLNVVKRNFCQHKIDNENGPMDEMFVAFKRFSCIARKSLIMILGFNFTEAILYYKIFSYIKR